ncbi:MAG TPA: phosphate ABC transporter permease PstA [Baekduia sp.]|nr:phosphate ABC transporter permease PstA [Baekduia sp.]
MANGATIAAKSIAAAGIGRPPRSSRRADIIFKAIMFGALAISVLALGLLLYEIVKDGAGAVTPEFFTNQPSKVRPQTAGAQSAIYGTLWLMAITAVIVIPIGVATAVYLEEYADRTKWWNRLIEVNIQNLAAVPSVVYGILGLAFFVRSPLSLGNVILAGGMTLALLVLPVVIIVAREAIRSVPPSIREGSLALGATQWQTIAKQVLPASIPGIATGVILALSRAIGETAPLLLIGAATSPRFNPDGLDSAFTALPVQIYTWSTDADRDNFLPLASAAILVLMAVLLIMNSIAIYLRNRYEQKW